MLLVFILLIVRERRELALLDSGAGSSANTIAETSQFLAGLAQEQRDDARIKLREQRLTPDDVRPPAAAHSKRRAGRIGTRLRRSSATSSRLGSTRFQRDHREPAAPKSFLCISCVGISRRPMALRRRVRFRLGAIESSMSL